MPRKKKDPNVDFLYECVLQLENIAECEDFFDDLCTLTELRALAQRIVVAKMLSEGKVYSDIVKQTGASTATISRVNRSLQAGADGYSTVFKRLK